MTAALTLGVCAPIDTRPLAPYLDTNHLPAGIGGTPAVALVRAAIESGWRVIVFSLDASLYEERIVAGPRLKLCMGPYRPLHRARDLFLGERRYLAAAIARERPDVVHAHWTYEFALGALDSGLPTVVTAHDRPLRILRWDHSPYRLARAAMAALVVRRARCLTAVSEPVATHFRRYFRWRRALPVIPNGIESEWFDTPDPLVSESLTFASVLSGWSPLKSGSILLAAFSAVREFLPDARLLLFGIDHGRGGPAHRWALARGLDVGVEFAGCIDRAELHARLRSVRALVHPSREESFSMPVAEAMAMGIPVIAARGSGGIAETLHDGRCALLADAGSPPSLAAAMLRIVRDPAFAASLAGSARAAALRELSIGRIWNAYTDLYLQEAG